MRLPKTLAATIAAACLLAAGLAPAAAPAAPGSLSISPGILERVARPGGLGAVTVSNTTPRPMRVTLAVRPWRQSRGGSVAPNRRKLLRNVRPGRSGFRLPAGGTSAVPLSLARPPKRGSLYGAIEVTGVPPRGGRKGIEVGYRLVASMRLRPPAGARRFKARPGRLYVKGRARRGTLALAVRNAGNTIDPIGATVAIRGRGRTLRNTVAPRAILPGRKVNLRLARLRGKLPRGRYRVTVRLTQAGRAVGRLRRAIQLR